MRKLTFILLACVLCPSLAGAWGLMPQCITRGPNGKNKPSCLGESFVTAGAVPCLEVTVSDRKKRTGNEAIELRKDLRTSVQKAFNAWINAVRDKIKVSDREAEFADFLQSFPTALEVRVEGATPIPAEEPQKISKRRRKKAPVPSAPARPVSTDKTCMNLKLNVGWEQDYTASTCADAVVLDRVINWYTHYFWYYDPDNTAGVQVRAMVQNSCHRNPKVLPHEIGHLLGLTDLYENKLEWEANEQVIVQDFSLLRMGIESSTMEQFSIMGIADERSDIGCDDVDAIINMADVMAVKRGTVSARVKNGWASFCSKDDNKYSSFRYAYGQPYRKDEEREENKKRIDAVLFFEKSYSKWEAEYNRLNAEIRKLNDRLDTAPRPLTTADLMMSAKVNYLVDLSQKVRGFADKVKEQAQDRTKPILEKYKELLDEEKQLNSFYAPEVLDTYTPHSVHLEAAVAKQPHYCIKCGKLIPPEDEVEGRPARHIIYQHSGCVQQPLYKSQITAYAKKYRYDREQKMAPELTYAQLRTKAVKEGINVTMANADVGIPLRTPTVSGAAGAAPLADNTRVGKPAANTSAQSATASTAGTSATGAGTTTLVPTSADQFSETALAGRPRAKVDPIPTPPAGSATATAGSAQPQPAAPPAELVCSVCGQKIANEADAYIPPERGRGPVHKHSECAFKYFSRFYSVDNTSLEQYNKSYLFGGEPRDVTAAKGLMKKLGLTPAEVKEYALAARAAYRAEADRYTQQQQADAAAREQRQRDLQTCANYVVVTADDIARFESANRGVLDAIAKRERERKNLTDKQKHVKRRLAQMKANQALTDYCQKIK